MKKYRKSKRLISQLFLLVLSSSCLNSAYAYKQDDVREIAPPAGQVSMLRGYSSNNGSLANVCIKPVGKSRVKSSVDNEAGNSRFEYITSFEEVMKEKKVDVSVDVKVRFGLGSAKASTDLSFYEKRNSEASSGSMWAYYSDNEAPEFSNPSANYQLTDDAKALLKKALKRGRPKLFSEFCGDEVVIGFKNGRYIEGFLSTSEMKSTSESEKQVKVEAAVSYMGSSGSAKVNVNGREFSKKEMNSLRIEMRTSGDAQVPNAVNLKSFRKAFRDFPTQPKSSTRDLINVFVIDYKDLVAASEFDFGLKRNQLRKVRTILNGLSTLERAANTAAIDARIFNQKKGMKVIKARYGGAVASAKIGQKNPFVLTRDLLKRELAYVKATLRANQGCLTPITKKRAWSLACRNLEERFNAFQHMGSSHFKTFMKTAYSSKVLCRSGHVITAPSGKQMCRQCSVAREPKFLKQGNGQCGYLAESKMKKGSKRYWAHNLKIKDDKLGGEAGSFIQKLTYPDWCKRKGTDCGKARAKQLCEREGYAQLEGFEVWKWKPKSTVHTSKFFTEYANGKRCSNNKDSFSNNRCRTFKYIDCSQAKGKSKFNKKDKNKGKKKNKKNNSKSN